MYRTLTPGNGVRVPDAAPIRCRSTAGRLIVGQVIGVRIPASELGLVAQRKSACLASRSVSVQVRPGPPNEESQGPLAQGKSAGLSSRKPRVRSPYGPPPSPCLRSSVDRVPVYETGCAGSTPAGGTCRRTITSPSSSSAERRFYKAEARGAAPRTGTVAVAQWQSSGL